MTKTVMLPDRLHDWLERNAATAGHASATDYLATLIETEEDERATAAVELKLIEEAEASGESDMTLDEAIAEAHRQLRAVSR